MGTAFVTSWHESMPSVVEYEYTTFDTSQVVNETGPVMTNSIVLAVIEALANEENSRYKGFPGHEVMSAVMLSPGVILVGLRERLTANEAKTQTPKAAALMIRAHY